MNTERQTTTWTIRAYRPGDERALTALFERVFGRAISEEHYRWKLRQPLAPVENVWLAVDDDAPIFHYAGIPTRYRLPDGEVMAMVSVDTMTAPEFQRRGLLSAVGRQVYDTWRAAGVAFVIGLPNERWGSRAGALGWEPLFQLQWLARPLRPEAILARRLRMPALARLTPAGATWDAFWRLRLRRDPAVRVRWVERAGAEFDQLWQRCGADAAASVVRDSAWVNWRYHDAPTFDYRVLLAERDGRPVGYAAYRVEAHATGMAGFVAELFAAQADAPARRTLIAETLTALRAAGADNAVTLAVPGSPLERDLRSAGFLYSRGAFGVQIVPLDPDLPLDVLRDPGSWNMAGGDFDVI
jgi:predicted N-acetyltransferase YhbS